MIETPLIANGDLGSLKPIASFNDAYFRDGVAESAKHAWYEGEQALHPWEGETEPQYTDFQDEGKYSWVKAPTFYGKRAEVGPLADVLVGVAGGDARYNKYLNQAIDTIKAVSQQPEIPLSALESTIGRHASRAVRCAVMVDTLKDQWQRLVDNPVADPENPLEVLRTVHSFDPCLACAIHMFDNERTEIVRVRAL